MRKMHTKRTSINAQPLMAVAPRLKARLENEID
jgi:hypothetical protein